MIGILLAASPGLSDTECQPAEPAVARGLVVRTALGPAFWTDRVGSASKPGLGFVFGAGYELFSWLALEVNWSSGFHDTNQPRPPAPGSFATYALHAGLRANVPIGPFDIVARGGGGFMLAQPDILVRISAFDGQARLSWLGGLGFVWHTPRRRVWIGLEATAIGAGGFPGTLIMASTLIGVTF
jgi:hypothetical protein